jgi:hypothetical protein
MQPRIVRRVLVAAAVAVRSAVAAVVDAVLVAAVVVVTAAAAVATVVEVAAATAAAVVVVVTAAVAVVAPTVAAAESRKAAGATSAQRNAASDLKPIGPPSREAFSFAFVFHLRQANGSNFAGMTPMTQAGCALTLLFLAACNSTAPPTPASTPGKINMKEPRRMVGTENNVRVDAEIYGEDMIQGASIAIKYEITNQRATPILVADLIAQSNYDPDTRTVTIDIGSEIPGEELLPRLIAIPSGERRTFNTGAHINIRLPPNSPWTPKPRALQLRVNFLGDPAPFAQLVGIPERAVRDKKLADELFPKWVERTETVTTNALPMRWQGPRATGFEDTPPARRRRGPG